MSGAAASSQESPSEKKSARQRRLPSVWVEHKEGTPLCTDSMEHHSVHLKGMYPWLRCDDTEGTLMCAQCVTAVAYNRVPHGTQILKDYSLVWDHYAAVARTLSEHAYTSAHLKSTPRKPEDGEEEEEEEEVEVLEFPPTTPPPEVVADAVLPEVVEETQGKALGEIWTEGLDVFAAFKTTFSDPNAEELTEALSTPRTALGGAWSEEALTEGMQKKRRLNEHCNHAFSQYHERHLVMSNTLARAVEGGVEGLLEARVPRKSNACVPQGPTLSSVYSNAHAEAFIPHKALPGAEARENASAAFRLHISLFSKTTREVTHRYTVRSSSHLDALLLHLHCPLFAQCAGGLLRCDSVLYTVGDVGRSYAEGIKSWVGGGAAPYSEIINAGADVTWGSLVMRVGQEMVWRHHGGCDHVLRVDALTDDVDEKELLPQIVYARTQHQTPTCDLCEARPAAVYSILSPKLPADSFVCESCSEVTKLTTDQPTGPLIRLNTRHLMS